MARDFRPKAAKKEAKSKSPQSAKEARKSDTRPGKKDDSEMASHNVEEGDDEDDEDDETLLREIRSLGGDESDLKLIKEAATSSRRNLDEDDDLDPALHKELQSFMKGLDFKAAAAMAIHDVEEEDVHAETGVQEKQKKEGKKDKNGQQTEVNVEPTRASTAQDVVEVKRRGPAGFVVVPSSRWAEIGTPDLSSLGSKANSKPTDAVISAMQEKANQMLSSERTHYSQLTNSGKTGSGGDGLLSASDAKFVADLLGSGSRSGTLSDRVAALTLLAQTSPIHNFDSLEKLLDMSGKKGREESGKATRSLGDWLASDVGLPDRKLRYFRDQPNLEILAATYNDVSLKGKERLMIDLSLVLFAFEDRLKRFYFDYLAILERQSHDTLPFVRKQAAGQIFVLLRDKPEQEQNLLRLLVNKLGDTDRSVASKASSHLLSLLNTHPAMKAVVTNEVSNLVLQAPSALSRKGKGQPNAHAQYYGILTLNQTMLTNNDATVANNLINLYFTLFEGLLRELAEHEAPKSQEKVESTVTDSKPQVPRKDKGRWRDTGRGGKKVGPKGGPRKDKEKASTPVQDADARIMAAILAGVRRALPFAKMDGVVIDKHMDTLFRITHSSTFNISIQALQLIFQVSNAGSATRGSSSASAIASSTNTQDRFYRTLYASMLDPRLAKTSKQAMYLNLLFKATKADLDDARCKAFVKRLCQLLTNSEPPFVCGSLFLLGELFRAKPGLRSMLNDAEEDGEEHFVDVDEEQADASLDAGVERNVLSLQALQQQRQRSGYDGDKRDPRYARAEHTCLWDLTPLLSHFHPSVALCAKQLLLGEQISTTADLTLHSLSHFLDRFVYRNPKKHVAASKGSSLMQPALHVNDSLETGVARLRGHGIAKEEFVNSDAFWRKKLVDVPVDQLFFHQFFNLRRSAATGANNEIRNVPTVEEGGGSDAASVRGDDDDDEEEEEEDSELEREIQKEMRRTMPRQKGDEMLDELDDEDDYDELDADLMDSTDDEDGDAVDFDNDEDGELDLPDETDEIGDESSPDEDEDVNELDEDDEDDEFSDNAFDEDEDDLLPYDFEADEMEVPTTGSKRKADEQDGEVENGEGKSKAQLQRAHRKKQKALPTFATADDYAHLLGNSDDDDEDN